MIYCPSCSTPWRGRGRFCGECGTPIDVEAAQETEVLPAMPPSVDEPSEAFRFGAPPPDPMAGYAVPPPPPVGPAGPEAQREPIALLQYWPVIVPGIIALISGLLILVQLIT
jgi:hypothetical protein